MRPLACWLVAGLLLLAQPAAYSRTRTWPVLVDLHGNGAQGGDGLIQTIRGMAEQIRRDRSRFPAIVVFPQAADSKRWFEGDMQELVIAGEYAGASHVGAAVTAYDDATLIAWLLAQHR